MKINMEDWKEFEVRDLFEVVYGVNLELVNCTETTKHDPEAVAFVSRTESNNGVSAYVKPIQGVNPQPENTITVAGGGSVLAAFLQTQPFYSGRDLYLLYPKEDISNNVKLFIVTIIKANKYRYNYGRQANVTLPYLKLRLPVDENEDPNWKWMDSYVGGLHSKPLATVNHTFSSGFHLRVDKWGEFYVNDLFDLIYKAPSYRDDELSVSSIGDKNSIAYVTRTDLDNGVKSRVDSVGLLNIEAGNAIVIGDTTSTISYQASPFVAGEHIVVARAKWLNQFTGLFVVCLLKRERYRYSYGRAYKLNLIRGTRIKLPVASDGNPDWKFIEGYMKSLPYGDKL